MAKKSLTKQQKGNIEGFLRGYAMNQKMLRMEQYEEQFFRNNKSKDDGMPTEEPLAKARMFAVRHFILSLENSDEKLFLYFHYIKGHTVSRSAEMLGISERAGFRMKNRALFMAYEKKFGIKDRAARL